jgi:signal transduction histidine kinase
MVSATTASERARNAKRTRRPVARRLNASTSKIPRVILLEMRGAPLPARGPRRSSAADEKLPAEAPSRNGKSKPPPRARDPLLAAICHDLRAPLAAVTMGTNFVLQTACQDEESGRARRILEAMLRSCAQMERLVRNFADLSEIEGDAVVLREGHHDAGEMLDFAAEASGSAAAARAITIVVSKAATPIVVFCDRERLLRAIGHVVENALKFAPDGSEVSLAVSEHAGTVSFRVSDRGVGLSPQVRRKLFDRQWHAKRANRVGAGFGLAIARGFMHAHGGQLTVESRRNVLTVFMLSLPRDGASGPTSAGRRTDGPRSTVRRARGGADASATRRRRRLSGDSETRLSSGRRRR